MQQIIADDISFNDYTPAIGAAIAFHRVGWHGVSGHSMPGMDGYISADPKNCDKECVRVMKLGGAIIDQLYHGIDSPFHRSVFEIASATERNGLLYHLNFGSLVGKTTQDYIDALLLAGKALIDAPNYHKIGGRPVVKFFGPSTTIDFTAIRKAVGTMNPLFLFNFSDGFNHLESDGAFGWPRPVKNPDLTAIPDDFNLAEILKFRNLAKSTGKIAFYPAYKGFYDPWPTDPTKSVWANADGTRNPVRQMNTQHGLVLLMTLALVPADALFIEAGTLDDGQERTFMLNSLTEL